MKRKHLLFTLLLALVMPLAANAQLSLPFEENFNLVTVGQLPNGWSAGPTSTGTGTVSVQNDAQTSYNRCLMFLVSALNSSGKGAVSVQIPQNGAGAYYRTMSFKLMPGTSAAGTFYIGYYTTELSGQTWNTIATYSAANLNAGAWNLMTIPVSLPANQTIVFRTLTQAVSGWALDNLSITDGFCPTNLSATPSVISATITWDANNASRWQLQYKASDASSWTSVTTTENPYTLTNLDPDTEYTVRVRAKAPSGTYYSGWSDILDFTTEALTAVPYPSNNFEIFAPHLFPGDIDVPDEWAGLVSPSGQGSIQIFNELVNPNFPNGPRNGWMRLNCTGTPSFNNAIMITAALPVFDCPVNLLRVSLLIKPSINNASECGNLMLGYVYGNDLGSFYMIESYNPADYSASDFTAVEKVITGIPANARLAIRYRAGSSGHQDSYWDVDYNMVTGGMVSEIVPANFQLTSSSDTEASFSWDAFTGATYELQCRTFDKGTNTEGNLPSVVLSTGSYTLENLDRRYRYYVRVRAVGYDDQGNPYYSSYTDELMVSPRESLVTEFPYLQLFNMVTNPVLSYNNLHKYTTPQWYYFNEGSNVELSEEDGYYSNVNDPYCYLPKLQHDNLFFFVQNEGNTVFNPQPEYAISPKISNLSDMQLSMTVKGYLADGVNSDVRTPLTFEVGAMTDPMDPTTFVLVKELTVDETYVDYDEIYLYAIPYGDAHIAIRVQPAVGKKSCLFVRSVLVDEAPNCKPIRHFAVVEGEVTDHSAKLTWETYNETQWEVQYRPVTSAGDKEWQSIIVDEAPNPYYTLSGLGGNVNYEVRVRTYCGEDEQGEWSDVISFLTECSGTFQGLPFYEDFESYDIALDPIPRCWPSVYYDENYCDLIDDGGVKALKFGVEANTPAKARLPIMTNLKHLKVRLCARIVSRTQGNYNWAMLLLRACDENGTVIGCSSFNYGYSTGSEDGMLYSTYNICEAYMTNDSIDEGYIELYVNSKDGCDIMIDWIEVSEAFEYNKHFTGEISNDWSNPDNWTPSGVPVGTDNVYLNDGKDVFIPNGCVARVNAIDFNSDNTTLTIKDGGILRYNKGQWHHIGAQCYKVLNVTMEKEIEAYTPGTKDHYYLLTVPYSNFNYGGHIIDFYDFDLPPNASDPNYINTDLYKFDPSYPNQEWRNCKNEELFLNPGQAVLYANAQDKSFSWDIRVLPPEEYELGVMYPTGNVPLYNWILFGNPYISEAYIRFKNTSQPHRWPYYMMNANGDAIVMAPNARPIKPLEGVFVQGLQGTYINYIVSPYDPNPGTGSKGGSFDLVVRQANTRSADVLDRARVQFGGGFDFEHCDIMPNPNRLYIPSDGKQLSVANAGTIGELPVNFEAAADDVYTLAIELEETDMTYLHLIDNLTGADIDLLQQSEYTFNAKYSDYSSRFKLLFAKGSTEHGNDFAFIRNGHLTIFGIEGTATVQVIDMLGHVLSTEQFNGSYDKQLNAAPGIYVIRLIHGSDVKTQKMVVR